MGRRRTLRSQQETPGVCHLLPSVVQLTDTQTGRERQGDGRRDRIRNRWCQFLNRNKEESVCFLIFLTRFCTLNYSVKSVVEGSGEGDMQPNLPICQRTTRRPGRADTGWRSHSPGPRTPPVTPLSLASPTLAQVNLDSCVSLLIAAHSPHVHACTHTYMCTHTLLYPHLTSLLFIFQNLVQTSPPPGSSPRHGLRDGPPESHVHLPSVIKSCQVLDNGHLWEEGWQEGRGGGFWASGGSSIS